MQFSSEDEADEIPLSEGDPDAMPDDDSQQAAEAMVQLGNIGYYPPASGVTNEQGKHYEICFLHIMPVQNFTNISRQNVNLNLNTFHPKSVLPVKSLQTGHF